MWFRIVVVALCDMSDEVTDKLLREADEGVEVPKLL